MRDRLIRFSLCACLCALAAPATLAQANTQSPNPAPPPFGRRMGGRAGRDGLGGGALKQERMERRALRRLNLSDAQREQMRAIEQRYAQTFRADREELRKLVETRRSGTALTPEQQARAKQLREGLRANAEKMRAEVQNVLTPEQRQQLEQSRDQAKQRREQRRQQRQNNTPPPEN
ncbi:MAG: Spy/CpxP family protein refolding chaperone [Pyrinomonadaceae bacterium]